MNRFIIAAVLAVSASGASAAAIDMFQSSSVGIFGMGGSERRETLFTVNSSVTLTALGAEIDPGGDYDFNWNIFTSDLSGAALSPVFTTTFSVTDIGLSVYDTAVNVTLGLGTYILELQNLDGPSDMSRYNESNEPLPFDIAGGAISVLDGFANNFSNSILPAFSISTDTPPPPTVPLPASVWLLGAGLIGLKSMRRSAKKAAR